MTTTNDTAAGQQNRGQGDELWTSQEFAAFIGGKFTAQAAAQLRHRGDGPRYVRFGKRGIRYWRSDVISWLDANIETQTPGAA